jgi:shikimate kinase
MRNRGFVVNLTASLSTIVERLEGAADRPLYSGQDAANRARALMDERKQFYADADIRIDTDKISVEDVAAKIMRILKGLPA